MATNLFRPGDRCGDNEVVGLLGTGGFAQVYEVVDATGARRALKVIDTEADARGKLEARLAQEGAALAMIHHVNVVRLYDAGLHGDRVFLLLELIHGRTLRAVLAERPAPDAVVRWIRQACEGVAEAHRIGAIHRDLKPENLLVTDGDVVKVIDFGIAKLLKWGIKTTHAQQLGTALYMSPEQIDGQPADPRMDVYALGILLYEALAGVHPIAPRPMTMIEVCARQMGHRPPPLRSVAPALPERLAALVDRAMEKDRARRVQTMRELSDGLQAALLDLASERVAAVQSLLPGASPFAVTAPVPSFHGGAASGPTPRAPVEPSSVLPSAGGVDALAATGPLSGSTSDPLAVTAPVPAPTAPPLPPPRPVRSRRRVVAVVACALALGVAGGAAAAVRALSWIHARRPAPSAVAPP